MTKEIYRVECDKISDLVEVEDGIIVDTLPIFRKFQGQPIGNLTGWIRKVFGWVTIKRVE